MKAYYGFRPLTGILFFNVPHLQHQRPWDGNGFRPLTGILFFNVICPACKEAAAAEGFRPLTGILFFNSANGVVLFFVPAWVSVPLRGFCFSTAERMNCIAACARCFRPLTGILFFNHSNMFTHPVTKRLMFPSPYGDFVFQPKEAAKLLGISVKTVSVPLRGFCFSTSAISAALNGTAFTGFRPLTGILFFNWKKYPL